MKTKQYRQGDVFVEQVASLPEKGLKKMKREGGRLVLAHGTATGHSHSIATESCELFSQDGSATPQNPGGIAWLRVKAVAAFLKHNEHAAIRLPKGNYRVVRQREYSPEAIRNVAD